MAKSLGITEDGLKLALDLKHSYRSREPLCLPGETDRLLMPEHLLNDQIDLQAFEDPFPLAMIAVRDPDPPMAVAAAVRMSPKAPNRKLITGMFGMLGDTSKHAVVKKCVEMVTDGAFGPQVLASVRNRASRFVVKSRAQYTQALRQNLRALLDGSIEPRAFVSEFFELSEAGNLRVDIRKRLILGLLTSDTIRPSIKFLFLENMNRLPVAVQVTLIREIERTPDSPALAAIKEEMDWIRRDLPAGTVH